MVDEKKVMEIDQKEYAIIINALMSLRNAMLQEEKETDLVDKVIKKTLKAPSKKKGIFFKSSMRNDRYETR